MPTCAIIGPMPTNILEMLIAERDKLNRAIAALDGTGIATVRSGRKTNRKRGGRASWSAAARKAVAVRLRRYWAEKRKKGRK